MCLDGHRMTGGSGTISDTITINETTNYIGYFNDSTTNYPLIKDNLKYLYQSNNGNCSSFNNTGDLNGSFYLNKYSVKGDKACVSNPEHTQIITNNDYQNNYVDNKNKKTYDNATTVCGIKEILSETITNFKTQRDLFQEDLIDLITSFNELSEYELEMLKKTNTNIDELNTIVNEYNELYNKLEKNRDIGLLVDTQVDDMSHVYKNSEYKMAIAGIVSIGALMALFNYMKK